MQTTQNDVTDVRAFRLIEGDTISVRGDARQIKALEFIRDNVRIIFTDGGLLLAHRRSFQHKVIEKKLLAHF